MESLVSTITLIQAVRNLKNVITVSSFIKEKNNILTFAVDIIVKSVSISTPNHPITASFKVKTKIN